MKKTIIPIAVGLMTIGSFAISASAEDYTVEEGDTLSEIASSHDMAVDDLKDVNDLDKDIIQPDQVLTINEDSKTHDVEEGDTLSQLSDEFDVSVDELKDWNNLDSDIIVVGQALALENAESDDDQSADDNDEKEKSDEADHESENDNNAKSDDSDDQSKDDNNAKSDDSDNQSEDESAEDDKASEGETINVSSTAYTAQCEACSGTTTTGIDLEKNSDKKVIAVDPDVIPLGSEVHVEGYGDAVAADTGGAINGDKIDVFMPDEDEANAWGNKDVEVTIKD